MTLRSRHRAARRRRGIARTFLVAHAVALAVAGVTVFALLAVDARVAARHEAGQTSRMLVETLARDPYVVEAVAAAHGDPAAHADATAALQPYTESILAATGVDYITLMDTDRTRYTHPNPDRIGGAFVGSIDRALAGETLTEVYEGTLGPSVRAVTPIVSGGDIVGLASAGVLLRDVSAVEAARLGVVGGITGLFLLLGAAAIVLMFRTLDRATDSRGAGELQVAFAAQRELSSVQTIADALRSQVHEFDNRLHTIASLIELGRTDEALRLATSRRDLGQRLTDRVLHATDQPVIAALMLGKTAQAHELGVEMHFETHLEPGTQGLEAADVVTILGNLIDNAVDAAAEKRHRTDDPDAWVEVYLASDEDSLVFQVTDSGDGVPERDRERIFRRGVSTKHADAGPRGYGLPLVRRTVERLGGTIEVGTGRGGGAEFTVTLPRPAGSEEAA